MLGIIVKESIGTPSAKTFWWEETTPVIHNHVYMNHEVRWSSPSDDDLRPLTE